MYIFAMEENIKMMRLNINYIIHAIKSILNITATTNNKCYDAVR